MLFSTYDSIAAQVLPNLISVPSDESEEMFALDFENTGQIIDSGTDSESGTAAQGQDMSSPSKRQKQMDTNTDIQEAVLPSDTQTRQHFLQASELRKRKEKAKQRSAQDAIIEAADRLGVRVLESSQQISSVRKSMINFINHMMVALTPTEELEISNTLVTSYAAVLARYLVKIYVFILKFILLFIFRRNTSE